LGRTGPVTYTGQAELAREIEMLKTAAGAGRNSDLNRAHEPGGSPPQRLL
jgi:hypothetical protein